MDLTAPIVIVGGGIAGLYAALLCADRFPGRPIEVHEASGRWGGRIHTYYGADYRYETGAGRFNSNHRRLLALIRRYGLTPQPIQGKKRYCAGAAATAGKPGSLEEALKSTPRPLPSQTLGEWLDERRTPKERRELQAAFGYDAEFDWMNAVDAVRLFKTDFKDSIAYFSLKEGLSALVASMVRDLKSRPGVRLNLRSALKNATSGATTAEDKTVLLTWANGTTTVAHTVFLALPKNALQATTGFKDLDAVREVPLHRIYGKFYRSSFYPMERTTTAGPIRQYIPIRPDKRISMVSYCDTAAADHWFRLSKNGAGTGNEDLKKGLEDALGEMVANCAGGPTGPIQLQWVRSYYWAAGVHVWKAGVDSKRLAKQLLMPMGPKVPCFIIGESYSRLQGWIEGSLWTVEEAMKNENL